MEGVNVQKMIERESGKITWGELKKLIEKNGIADDGQIDRIDIAWGNANEIEISYDEDFGWQIYL